MCPRIKRNWQNAIESERKKKKHAKYSKWAKFLTKIAFFIAFFCNSVTFLAAHCGIICDV